MDKSQMAKAYASSMGSKELNKEKRMGGLPRKPKPQAKVMARDYRETPATKKMPKNARAGQRALREPLNEAFEWPIKKNKEVSSEKKVSTMKRMTPNVVKQAQAYAKKSSTKESNTEKQIGGLSKAKLNKKGR